MGQVGSDHEVRRPAGSPQSCHSAASRKPGRRSPEVVIAHPDTNVGADPKLPFISRVPAPQAPHPMAAAMPDARAGISSPLCQGHRRRLPAVSRTTPTVGVRRHRAMKGACPRPVPGRGQGCVRSAGRCLSSHAPPGSAHRDSQQRARESLSARAPSRHGPLRGGSAVRSH